jgi:hypothetical protein
MGFELDWLVAQVMGVSCKSWPSRNAQHADGLRLKLEQEVGRLGRVMVGGASRVTFSEEEDKSEKCNGLGLAQIHSSASWRRHFKV